MKKNYYYLICYVLFFLNFNSIFAQGSLCSDVGGENGATPFCSISGISFPNCYLGNPECTIDSQAGPNYGCLLSQPFPSWHFLKIAQAGPITLNIVQTSNEDGTGNQLDVDFICYGPFSDPITPCFSELTAANTIDCSFSTSFNEFLDIPFALNGEFYLVLITNFSEDRGFISVTQVDDLSTAGSTDCSILNATLGPDLNLCGADSALIESVTENAIDFKWSIFNERTASFDLLAGETQSSLLVSRSGTYQLLVEDSDGETAMEEINVLLNQSPVVASEPSLITTCELSLGTGLFDFSGTTSLLLGSQSEAEFNVSYHRSIDDAENGVNPISDGTRLSSSIVYPRIERSNLNSCFVTTSLEVEVLPEPLLSNTNYRYFFCEVMDTTPNQAQISIDAIGDWLTDAEDNLVNLLADAEPLSRNNFDITYHRTVGDALNNLASISNGDIITNNQVIYVRVENNTNENPTGCFNVNNIARITVSFNQIPIGLPSTLPDLFGCETSILRPGFSTFDLTSNEPFISFPVTTSTSKVLFFRNEEDFNLNTPIDESEVANFSNTVNQQTIFATIFDPAAACQTKDFAVFQLNVVEAPQLINNSILLGERKVCVFDNGDLQNPFTIGEDIGLVDGEEYVYDWTPDNPDLDSNGNESPIYNVSTLTSETKIRLKLLRKNSFGLGIDCSNSVNPVTLQDYEITLIPSFTPKEVQTEVKEDAFSSSYTIEAVINDSRIDVDDLEFKLGDSGYQDSPIFNNIFPGEFQLSIRNKFGCIPNVISKTIELLDYPKFFTPNNDGINDTWNLISTQIPNSSIVRIFNRYGKLLAEVITGGAGWDGTYRNKVLPSDDYWFFVEYIEPRNGVAKTFSSSFTLKR